MLRFALILLVAVWSPALSTGRARDTSLHRPIVVVVLTPTTLDGATVRLEPLVLHHLDGLPP